MTPKDPKTSFDDDSLPPVTRTVQDTPDPFQGAKARPDSMPEPSKARSVGETPPATTSQARARRVHKPRRAVPDSRIIRESIRRHRQALKDLREID